MHRRRSSCLLTAPIALALACAGALPVPKGEYKPTTLVAEADLPVVVRSVRVVAAAIDQADGSPLPIALTEDRLRRVERELHESITTDLHASGPFRAPGAGEAAYVVDVEFLELTMPAAMGASVASASVIGLTLGVGLLLGVPFGGIRKKGEAVFRLYAPDGATLIDEFATTSDKAYAIGLYYGRKKPLGIVARPLVKDFKREALRKHGDILAMAPIETPASSQPRIAQAAEPTPTWTPAAEMVAEGQFVSTTPQRAAYGLVIGISDYRDIGRADGGEQDAARFDAMLEQTLGIPAEHRRTLLGARATKTDIEKSVRWLVKNAKAGSRVYVFFSGHGAPNPATGTPYLVPYDGDPNDLDATALPLSTLVAALEKSRARESVVILDACFSGQGARSVIARGTRPLVRVETPTTPGAVVILAAASGAQTANSLADASGGLFSHYVTEALGSGEADSDGDSAISLRELWDWVSPRVARAARQQKREQTPTMNRGKAVGRPADVVLAWGYPDD